MPAFLRLRHNNPWHGNGILYFRCSQQTLIQHCSSASWFLRIDVSCLTFPENPHQISHESRPIAYKYKPTSSIGL